MDILVGARISPFLNEGNQILDCFCNLLKKSIPSHEPRHCIASLETSTSVADASTISLLKSPEHENVDVTSMQPLYGIKA